MVINPNQLTGETLALVKGLLASPLDLKKAGWVAPTSAVSGINNYDLQPRALQLFPVLTPLRNRIPRTNANGGVQANWRAITGINSGHLSPGLSEGNRNAALTHTTADYFAAYRELGFDDFITWKAEYAAEGFDDAKALTVDNLLRATMIGEELIDLGGNTSLALGTTPTPSLTAGSSGSITGTPSAFSVICVALTNDGYIQLAGANNGTTGEQVNVATATLSAVISRVNMDSSTDTYGGGVAQKSANQTVNVTSSTGNVLATVTAVTGAVAYAWFWAATAGSEALGAVTTINSVNITAAATGTLLASSLPSSDNSKNALVYDGFLSMLSQGLGSYYKVLPTGTAGTGSPLTSDGAGGIKEINDACVSFWNLYRLSPQTWYVNAQQMIDMNAKVIAGGGAPLFRYNMDATGEINITGGVVLASLLNKITSRKMDIVVHPNMPPGTMMAYSDEIPYPLSGVRQVVVKRCRYDYRAMEWPMTRRRHEYGVYFDGVLQNYFFPAFGLITNVAQG